jgi:signal transduction histidine kinase
MNKRTFLILFGRAIVPVTLCYLLLVSLAGLLVILYNLPLLFFGDLLRFSLPVLGGWLIFTFYRTRQRYKKLHAKAAISPSNPVEAALITLLTAEKDTAKSTIRDLHLKQQQQFDHLELFAHEIKNHLATLTAAAENQDQVASIDVKEAVRHANYYLDLLLSDERLAMEDNDFAFQWIDLAALVNDVLQQNSALFIHKQLIPQLHQLTGVRVLTDPKWLRFCIAQLLSNAIKYSQPNQTIDISWEINQLHIIDHGCGIPSTDLPRIYDNGFTGHNGHQTTLSTGMGLYLVKKIAQQLNYQLSVTSAVNKGTTATLTFTPANVSQR